MKKLYIILLLGFLVNTKITKAQVANIQDSLQLVNLYDSTGGANWTNHAGWLTAIPAKLWYGVTLNSDGRVISINLAVNNLTGRIQDLNLNLPFLKTLFLGTNQLTGNIPMFTGLPNLEILDLGSNSLSGNIPPLNLPQLKTLYLSRNPTSGTIPDFNLPSLVDISLYGDHLTGPIPNFNFPALQYLNLNANQLSETIPNFNFPQLKRLDISDNKLTGEIPNFNFPFIREFHLWNNQLTGPIPNFNFPELLVSFLNNNKLTGPIPNFNFPKLQTLTLVNNQLSGPVPNFTFPSTAIINWEYNKLNFEGLEYTAQHYSSATYSPQANITISTLNDKLYVLAGGTLSNNTYKWYRNNVLVATITGDQTFKPQNSGTYRVEVTNTVATQLTLKSDDYSYFTISDVKLIDPNPSMINSDGTLINDVSKIDDNKIVIGGATDGVTKILLVVESTEILKFSLQNPKDGDLKRLNNQNEFANEITVNPVEGKAVAIYEVPDGYGLNNPRGGRNIIVKVSLASNQLISKDIVIKLVTPPVVLVHGMWSGPSVWETEGKIPDATFVKALIKEKFEPPALANYEEYNAATFDPDSPESEYGRAAVKKAITNSIDLFRKNKIAVSQTDVVGHSLGGLMTRSFSQQENEFILKENYLKGFIHKLITIGTPHRGSPLGPEFYSHKDQWFKFYFFGAPVPNLIPFWSAIKAYKKIGTCHRDFGIESSGIKHLKQTLPFYTYAITGNYKGKDPFPEETYGYNALDAVCKLVLDKPLDSIFKSRCGGGIVLENDLCVPLESQKGYTLNHSDTLFFGTAHSGPANFTETTTPFLQAKVIRLLLSDDITEFSPGFPAPYNAASSNDCETTTQKTLQNPINKLMKQQSPNGDQFIKISSPLRGSIYQSNSGSPITLSIDVIGGAVPKDALFITKDLGWYPLPKTPPYSVNFTLPANAPLGKIDILVLAKDTSGLLLADTSHIIIMPSGVLDSMVVDPDKIELDSSFRTQSIYVKGYYKNGSDITLSDLTDGSTGTNYSTQKNNTIFKVDLNGVVTAVSPGTDTLIIVNGNKTIKVPVVVNSDFSTATLFSNVIDFPIIEDATIGDNPFGLSASSSSGDQVNFSVVSGPATITNGIISITGSGPVTVKASQQGNVYFAAAADVSRTFCVRPLSPIIAQNCDTLSSNVASNNQWYKDGVLISGAINQKLAISSTGVYTSISTENSCQSLASNSIIVTTGSFAPTPTITAGSAITFCTGGSVTLTSDAVSGNQWYKDGSLINGSTGATLNATTGGSYTTKVTLSGCESSVSNAIAVTIYQVPPTPTITAGLATTFCSGGSVTLTSNAASGNQWYKDGVSINGSNGITLNASESGTYTTKVTLSGCESLVSNTIAVTVNSVPPIPTISQNLNQLTSSATSGNQWYLNGNPISGATNQTYAVQASGFYTVKVTVNGCTSTSAVFNFVATGLVDPSVWNHDVLVYPNPVNDNLYILNTNNRKLAIVLMDITGRIALQYTLTATNGYMNIGKLAKGIYLVGITDKQKNETIHQIIIKQ